MKGRPVFVGCVAVLVLTACGGAGVSGWVASSYCCCFFKCVCGGHVGAAECVGECDGFGAGCGCGVGGG